MSYSDRTDTFLGNGNGNGNGSSDSYSSYSQSSSSADQSSIMGKVRANRLYILYGLIAVLAIVIIGLAVALHSAQNKENSGNNPPPTPPNSTTATNLRDYVTIDRLMVHANQLQNIANTYGNRYINHPGFNATVAYIESVLRTNAPTYNITKQYFTRQGFEVVGTPDLIVTAGDDSVTYAYGTMYNTYINSRGLMTSAAPLVSVLNGGCTAADWTDSLPSTTIGAIAVVMRSTCSAAARETLAVRYGAIGVIQYNNDPNQGLLALDVALTTRITQLTMRYEEGHNLEFAIREAGNSTTAARPTLALNLTILTTPAVITNLCADTATGDPTSTIVIGSHSDGVVVGAGLSDNGSGTCGNLVWAVGVHQLLQTDGFVPFPSRLRFCWWGAEEQGLLGSRYYTEVMKNATDVGWRLADHQLNLNYDMMATPNYVVSNTTDTHTHTNTQMR